MDAPERPTPLPVRRVVLQVEYDGTRYRGLQRQPHDEMTVQQKIEDAARRLGSADPAFVASGRTDSGVHALGQVVAINLPERLSLFKVPVALHALLPDDIRIRRAAECPADFSPRFDAIRRTYHYRLVAAAHPNPLERHFVARTGPQLFPELVIGAAAAFQGFWEMREWRSSDCQATRTRLHIDTAQALPPDGDRAHWLVTFAARSFLHHQVRFMMGGIIAVGCGKLSLGELQSALAEGRRPIVVAMQPACGLCLARVDFPADKDPFSTPGSLP